MSVIVFRSGIVAADTRMTMTGGGWISPERTPKIWTTPLGVAGIVGAYSPIDALRDWTYTDRKLPMPKVGADTTVIDFRRGDGIFVTEADWTYRQPIGPHGFFAWGSGRIPAMGALYAGCSAERTVEIAMLVDNDCGGDVTVLPLEENLDGQ